jgi:hypothetical protein
MELRDVELSVEEAGNRVWYLALCAECSPHMPQPFSTDAERLTWVEAHVNATSHPVIKYEEPK